MGVLLARVKQVTPAINKGVLECMFYMFYQATAAAEAYIASTLVAPLVAGAYSNLGKLAADDENFTKVIRRTVKRNAKHMAGQAEEFFLTAAKLEPNTCTSHNNVAAAIRSQGGYNHIVPLGEDLQPFAAQGKRD